MAFITADRVKDTSTTTGTGNITVSGSAPFGYRTFSTVLSVSDTFYYCIQGQGTSEWEVGLGTYVSSDQFARTTVLSSSASGSAVSFSSGTKNVFITLAADKTLQIGPSSSVTVPTVIGGTTASSSLTLQSTSGVGTSDSILFKVGNNGATTAMTVDTSGNVGIGKTPGVSAMLDVLGNATFGSVIANGNGVSTGTASIELGGNRTGDGVSFIDIHSTSGSDYETRIIRAGGTNGVFDIINQGTGTFALTAVGAANMVFQTSNTERMRIDSSGNVGIGTTSPGSYAKLTVLGGSIHTDAALYSNDGTTISRVISSSGVSYWGTVTNHPVVYQTNSTERMRIDSSGNVGIGTASPGVKLDVSGVMRAATWSLTGTGVTGGTTAFSAGTVSTDTNWGMYFRAPTGSAGIANYSFRDSSDTALMTIDSSGNVGVGATANASAILDAQSTTKGVRFPNMTTTQKNAVSSPAAGLVVFDTTLAKLCVYSGSAWQTITSI